MQRPVNRQGSHNDKTVVAVSSLPRISRKGLSIHSPPALFCFCFVVVVLSGDHFAHTNSTFLRPVASELVFLERFSLYARTAQSAHSDFVGSRVYACIAVTCHLHFWQNDRGLLRATAVTRGWNGHRMRVSAQSELWRKK